MNDKIRIFLKMYASYAALGVICALYVATSFLQIDKSGKSVMDILFEGFLAFVAGFCINNLLGTQGIVAGAREKPVMDAVEYHETQVEEVTDLDGMDELDEWCGRMNRKNYRTQRTRVLSKEGLSYGSCFTEEGEALPLPVREPGKSEIRERGLRLWLSLRRTARRQIKAYRRAVSMRLTELSAGELTGEGGRSDDPFWMGRGVGEYRKQTAIRDLISKVLTSIVLGYYSMDLIADFSIGMLLWRIIQVAIFLVLGAIQYGASLSYMTDEYRERRRKKGRHLIKFLHEFKKLKGVETHEQQECTLGGGSSGYIPQEGFELEELQGNGHGISQPVCQGDGGECGEGSECHNSGGQAGEAESG